MPHRILVTGASGFLGQRLVAALAAAGHAVVAVSRHPGTGPGTPVSLDITSARTPAAWLPLLQGVHTVVNAAGIFRESGAQTFQAVHVDAPRALFEACVKAGVRRVVQVSALGADDAATSAYHLSKREADRHLLTLPLAATIVQPSLVFGPGGASARLFGAWATAPLVPLPGRGDQRVQPIHVEDAVDALVALIESPRQTRATVALVGPEAMTMRAFLAGLRRGYGLPPVPALPVPLPIVRLAAHAARLLPGSLLDPDSLSMLERGNTGPVAQTVGLLGRAPRPVHHFVTPAARPAATLAWALPTLRWSVGLVWIVTGLLSWGLYPVDDSLALLARLGAEGGLALLLLYGAATLDLLLGAATLWPRRPRGLWAAQALLILGYTALITVWLPDFWLHPFGPLLKNLPMLAAILMLAALEERRPWTT